MNRSRKAPLRPFGVVSVAVSALIAVGGAAIGQSNETVLTTQPQPQTITYAPGDIYLEGSRVFVYVGKTGLGHEHGVVGQIKEGSIQLDADQNAGHIIFDMASFDADTEAARKYIGLSGTTDASTRQKVTANMRGPDVLDVRQYPTASFKIESSHRLPKKSKRGFPQYRLDGSFTLHGVTRPVAIIAEAEPKGGWLHVRGSFAILQTDFGITPFSKAFGAIGITDQLKIWGDIWIAGPHGMTVAAPATRKR